MSDESLKLAVVTRYDYTGTVYTLFDDFVSRPEPFSVYTAKELWTSSHISKQMLRAHLDPESDRASRRTNIIDSTVAWIDSHLVLKGKKLCDLGCGPGLYAMRFHAKGASVTGIDFSPIALKHAATEASEACMPIDYVEGDYLDAAFPEETDVFTLIFNDYCALSPSQRSLLLLGIKASLVPGGYLVMDVYGVGDFERFEEKQLVEKRLMNGFWADGEYVGFLNAQRYFDEKITLERYLIIESDRHWQIYNWLQYYSPKSLESELREAGFEIEKIAGSLNGETLHRQSTNIGVIARAS